MKVFAGLVVGLMLLSTVASVSTLAVSIDLPRYASSLAPLLSTPELKQFLGEGDLIIQVQVYSAKGTQARFFKRSGESITDLGESYAQPADYIISGWRDAFLNIANAPDKALTAKRMLAAGAIKFTARDPAKQAAIAAALSSGLFKVDPIKEGDVLRYDGEGKVRIEGGRPTLETQSGRLLLNNFGGIVGAFPRNYQQFSTPPARTGIFFRKPPGILSQFPGLIYDTTTRSPNVMGPHNVFKINPGLIGPNDILRLNPGLIGPADIARLNPGLRGPGEFAHIMGIGAHSNSVRFLQQRGLIDSNDVDDTNRWGNRR